MSFHRIKPILFNTEMVRAILAGRKTVTRRVIKGVSHKWDFIEMETDPCVGAEDKYGELYPKEVKGLYATFEWEFAPCDFPMIKAPYQVGDILYVRETWCRGTDIWNCERTSPEYFYKEEFRDESAKDIKWRPSIHMPKEAARIWLKVTDVRVERLQDITDYIAEGVSPGSHSTAHMNYYDEHCDFIALWDSTIKKQDLDNYGWDANPWVWVIEFERIER